jgi:hypothetical protein
MNPILPSDVDKVLDADAFVCLPITDYEVGQPTLRYIKESNGSAIIVLDAYGPTGTLTRSGERHPRVWADRDVWLPYIDILKMNLEEASSTWLGDTDDRHRHHHRLRGRHDGVGAGGVAGRAAVQALDASSKRFPSGSHQHARTVMGRRHGTHAARLASASRPTATSPNAIPIR